MQTCIGMKAIVCNLIDSTEAICNTPSSVSIPERYLVYYQHRCDELGGRSFYFHYIVNFILPCFKSFEEKLKKSRVPGWKVSYQECGQDLSKRSFFTNPDDWEIFRDFAALFGISMCSLFVFLMVLEKNKFFESTTESKTHLGRNSLPRRPHRQKKYIKFSKNLRILDLQAMVISRKLKIE